MSDNMEKSERMKGEKVMKAKGGSESFLSPENAVVFIT
jgi:hypothetical protein